MTGSDTPRPSADEIRALVAEREVLRRGLRAVQEMIDGSFGVAGLHLNGDVAPWESLLPGGQFEEWLAAFETARQAVEVEDD